MVKTSMFDGFQYPFTAWRAWQTESLIKCLLTLRIKSVIVEASQKFPG
jgi:hypothetical protein